jgi:hypothetical protein
MISLRVRRPGSSDWTYIFFSGEEDEHLLLLLAGRVWTNDFLVERQDSEDDWIPFDEYEEEG